MTDNSEDQPKNRKYPKKLWQYIGDAQPELKGCLFIRIAEGWPEDGEIWKFGFDSNEVFAINIAENHYQPPPVQKLLCSVIETPTTVEVGDKNKAGGFIWSGTKEEFEKNFKQKGNQ